jgi:dTDP-4-amino-4,6-dideoxygalactose transaminase
LSKVPFFDYTQIYKQDYPIYKDALHSVLERADFILRSDLEEFEKDMANYMGALYCLGVGNGTDAIWLSLIAAGINRGDEVIIPTHTYVATADAIWAIGAIPVLVDILDDHSISPSAIIDAISEKTAAVIAVNLNGRACELSKIKAICDQNNLVLIEDNAQGVGARIDGKSAGTFGTASSLSFYPAKILGGLGDGGGVVTDSQEIYEKIFRLRSHGRDHDNLVVEWGFNSRLDNMQAAVLGAKLKHLDRDINQRRTIARIYQDLLSDCDQIRLPELDEKSTRRFDSFQNYEIEAEDRENLRSYLADKGVGTIIQWGGKMVHQFGLPGLVVRDVSNAERIVSKMLLLPMNQYLTESDAIYVANTILEFYPRSK